MFYHFVTENQGTTSASRHSHSFPAGDAWGSGSSRGTGSPVKQDEPVSGGGDLPMVFLFLRGWGQRRIKHLLILPSTSLSPRSSHCPPTPTVWLQPLVEGLCTTPPSAASCPQVTLQMPVGASSACGRSKLQRARSCTCTLRGWHCTRRTGKPLRVPSGLMASQTVRMWLGIWSLEMAKLLAHGGRERKSWGGRRGY